jgi:hypothetical protein
VIVNRNGIYTVVSKSGKKLGGPYRSKKAALKRLRQIESFSKNKGS